ncbi:hypothetical protein BDY21DRAFT_378761 [Lineolata rhizophorae]|uniref:Uncharacterized protein n=1 Tax=Lineolata rhizophorae TaxID=578093 RepID=A0A6A6P2Y5_9PEZI|nr:hypothetical protein BDY21DRAFT_378761 [Lineolata rhizophorae]
MFCAHFSSLIFSSSQSQVAAFGTLVLTRVFTYTHTLKMPPANVRPANVPGMTSRQAKADYRKHGPRISAAEAQNQERYNRLMDRREQAEEEEKKRQLAKQRRKEKERKEREKREALGIGMATQLNGWSYSQKRMRSAMEGFLGVDRRGKKMKLEHNTSEDALSARHNIDGLTPVAEEGDGEVPGAGLETGDLPEDDHGVRHGARQDSSSAALDGAISLQDPWDTDGIDDEDFQAFKDLSPPASQPAMTSRSTPCEPLNRAKSAPARAESQVLKAIAGNALARPSNLPYPNPDFEDLPPNNPTPALSPTHHEPDALSHTRPEAVAPYKISFNVDDLVLPSTQELARELEEEDSPNALSIGRSVSSAPPAASSGGNNAGSQHNERRPRKDVKGRRKSTPSDRSMLGNARKQLQSSATPNQPPALKPNVSFDVDKLVFPSSDELARELEKEDEIPVAEMVARKPTEAPQKKADSPQESSLAAELEFLDAYVDLFSSQDDGLRTPMPVVGSFSEPQKMPKFGSPMQAAALANCGRRSRSPRQRSSPAFRVEKNKTQSSASPSKRAKMASSTNQITNAPAKSTSTSRNKNQHGRSASFMLSTQDVLACAVDAPVMFTQAGPDPNRVSKGLPAEKKVDLKSLGFEFADDDVLSNSQLEKEMRES